MPGNSGRSLAVAAHGSRYSPRRTGDLKEHLRGEIRSANGWDKAQARAAMMLDPAVANLNTGSFGPLPRVVFERVTQLRRCLAEEPMDFLVRALPPLLWEARERLAAFVGGDPKRLVFTANVPAAVNPGASSPRLA